MRKYSILLLLGLFENFTLFLNMISTGFVKTLYTYQSLLDFMRITMSVTVGNGIFTPHSGQNKKLLFARELNLVQKTRILFLM